jgi:hypothetical protein
MARLFPSRDQPTDLIANVRARQEFPGFQRELGKIGTPLDPRTGGS